MQKLNLKTDPSQPKADAAKKQPLRLMVALVLLLVALGVVLMKDRDFWFGPEDTADSDTGTSERLPESATAKPAVVVPVPQPPDAETNKSLVAKNTVPDNTEPKTGETKIGVTKDGGTKIGTPKNETKIPASNNAGTNSGQISKSAADTKTGANILAKNAAPPVATQPGHSAPTSSVPPAAGTKTGTTTSTKRTVLPPLDVEVIAADAHHNPHPASNVAKADIPHDTNRTSTTAANTTPSVNAVERGRLSTGPVPELRQAIESPLPLLGQHSRVQGSVVLQAVVGVDGSIEDLRVISGPAILSTAAQQAVRAWRFKPYLQNGQPVETKARITVNFSIRVSDAPSST